MLHSPSPLTRIPCDVRISKCGAPNLVLRWEFPKSRGLHNNRNYREPARKRVLEVDGKAPQCSPQMSGLAARDSTGRPAAHRRGAGRRVTGRPSWVKVQGSWYRLSIPSGDFCCIASGLYGSTGSLEYSILMLLYKRMKGDGVLRH